MKSSMFLKPSSKNVWMYVIYFVVIVALLIAFGKYFQITQEYYENFGDFSPYHPDKQAKVVDQILMDGRLKEYEKHNQCDGGYINLGLPPPNPIYSYPTLSFHPLQLPEETVPKYQGEFEKDYQVCIMGDV